MNVHHLQKIYSMIFLLLPPLPVPEIFIFFREHKQLQRTSCSTFPKRQRWKKKTYQRKRLNDFLDQFMSLCCQHRMFRVQWARWTCFTWASWLYTHPAQIPWQTLLYENHQDLPNCISRKCNCSLNIICWNTGSAAGMWETKDNVAPVPIGFTFWNKTVIIK